jgi:hypothetical protein
LNYFSPSLLAIETLKPSNFTSFFNFLLKEFTKKREKKGALKEHAWPVA